jgi:hypothetical protein
MRRLVTHSLHCVCIPRGAHEPPSRFPLPARSTHARLISYQGFLNETALNTAEEFTVTADGRCTVLSRGWWSLNVSHAVATAALTVRGVVVSADLSPPVTATAKECDPPGWKGTAPGIATTVASRGACLRSAREPLACSALVPPWLSKSEASPSLKSHLFRRLLSSRPTFFCLYFHFHSKARHGSTRREPARPVCNPTTALLHICCHRALSCVLS